MRELPEDELSRILRESAAEFGLDPDTVEKLWRHGLTGHGFITPDPTTTRPAREDHPMTAPVPDLTGRRISNLEARVGTVEETLAAHETTLYKLHRRATRTDLVVTAIATHLGLTLPTEADIDAALDAE